MCKYPEHTQNVVRLQHAALSLLTDRIHVIPPSKNLASPEGRSTDSLVVTNHEPRGQQRGSQSISNQGFGMQALPRTNEASATKHYTSQAEARNSNHRFPPLVQKNRIKSNQITHKTTRKTHKTKNSNLRGCALCSIRTPWCRLPRKRRSVRNPCPRPRPSASCFSACSCLSTNFLAARPNSVSFQLAQTRTAGEGGGPAGEKIDFEYDVARIHAYRLYRAPAQE